MGKKRQGPTSPHPLSARLAEVRRIHYGDRGRSSFARDLGIPVTSYVHYESDRVPPAELVLTAARLTGTSLEWLMSGAGHREALNETDSETPAQRIAAELLRLLERSPRLLPSAEEFIQLLENLGKSSPRPTLPKSVSGMELIPVIGSTAAGLAHFWDELDTSSEGPATDAKLETILSSHFEQSLERPGEATSSTSSRHAPVALVQYSQPDQNGFLEFLSAAELKEKYPRAVAWRIDGDSMSPRYRDGELVITSPDYPAAEMQPCVARQKGQIGVNCKLFQTSGNDVLLIPINETCTLQRFPRKQLLWAWRVLASVRLQ